MASGISVHAIQETSKLYCSICGGTHLYRLQRKGFLEKRIYPLFGYFPWHCLACKEDRYIKLRNVKRRKRAAESL